MTAFTLRGRATSLSHTEHDAAACPKTPKTARPSPARRLRDLLRGLSTRPRHLPHAGFVAVTTTSIIAPPPRSATPTVARVGRASPKKAVQAASISFFSERSVT